MIDTVHILPFFPSGGDDGFSVIDYKTVEPQFGCWSDITALASSARIMADLVINHGSAQSTWFQKFLDWDKLTFGDMIDNKLGFISDSTSKDNISTINLVNFSVGIDLKIFNADAFLFEHSSFRVWETKTVFRKRSDDKIVAMGQKNMHQRVAEIIMELPMHFETLSSGFIDVKLRREDLANLVGVATESLIRAFSYFQEKN